MREFDPTHLPFLKDSPYAYASREETGRVYPYSEWQFKLSTVTFLPKDFSIGTFLRYQQGYPYGLFASVPDCGFGCQGGGRQILVEPFGRRRYENLLTMDLEIQKSFDCKPYLFTMILDVYSIWSSDAVLSRNRNVTSPEFHSMLEHLAPGAVVLRLRYSF